jgi:hypothetical protein
MGAGFSADGRIDMAKLIVAFRNFENAPKNVLFAVLCVCPWWERLHVADEDECLI